MADATDLPFNSTTGPVEQSGIPPVILFILNFLIPYALAFMLPVGIAGNLCSIFIFFKNRKKDSVSAQYLGLLAFSDFVVIAVKGVPIWLYINLETVSYGRYKYDKQYPTNLGCKIGGYIWNLGAFLSGWIVTIFSLERCLVIWYPLKMAIVVGSSKPRKILLSCVVIFGIVSYSVWTPWLELISVQVGKEPSKCFYVVPPETNRIIAGIHNFFFLVLPFVIPLISITALNILLLVGIRRNRMSSDSKSGGNEAKQDKKMLKNLMLVSLFYIILNTMFTSTWYINVLAFESNDFYGMSAQARKDLTKIWLVADLLHYINFCINPFVYTFSLDYYQAQLKRIFCRCTVKEKPKAVK